MELKQKRIINHPSTPIELKKSNRLINMSLIKTICKYLPISNSKIDQNKRKEYLNNWATIGTK